MICCILDVKSQNCKRLCHKEDMGFRLETEYDVFSVLRKKNVSFLHQELATVINRMLLLKSTQSHNVAFEKQHKVVMFSHEVGKYHTDLQTFGSVVGIPAMDQGLLSYKREDIWL